MTRRFPIQVNLSLTVPADVDDDEVQLHADNVRRIIEQALAEHGYLTPERAGPLRLVPDVSTDEDTIRPRTGRT